MMIFFFYHLHISGGSNFQITVGHCCSLKHASRSSVLENVVVRSESTLKTKCETVDSAILCFVNAV